MINPNRIVRAYVEALQAAPEVINALGGNTANVQSYEDAAPGSFSIARAIMRMREPGVLVAWMGTSPSTVGLGLFAHEVSVYVRASVEAPYANIITAILNARGRGDTNKLINQALLPELQPMEIPTTKRIQDEEGSVDMFEISTRFEEALDADQTISDE